MPTADERTALLAPERETKRPLTPTKKYLIVTTTLLSGFLSTLDLTIVATCIPTISSELQVSNQEAWIGTAYLWSSVTFTPLYGRLSDLIGRKPAYLQAVVLFTIGTAACGFAPTFTTLVVARFVAGMGGGGMGTVASVITADTFSPAERGFYQGLSFAMFGAGMGLGGPIGGFLTQYFGWRAAFYSQLPLAAITVLMILLSVPTAETHQSISLSSLAQIDFGGALTLLISIGALLQLLSIDPGSGPLKDNAVGIAMVVIFVAAFIAFLYIEIAVAVKPVLPLSMLRRRTPLCVGIISSMIAIVNFNMLYHLPMVFEIVFQQNLALAGAHLLPNSIAMTISAPIAGYIVKRTSRYKWLIVISCAGPLVAMILISQLTPQSWEPLQWICFSSLLTLTLMKQAARYPTQSPPRDPRRRELVGSAKPRSSDARARMARISVACAYGCVCLHRPSLMWVQNDRQCVFDPLGAGPTYGDTPTTKRKLPTIASAPPHPPSRRSVSPPVYSAHQSLPKSGSRRLDVGQRPTLGSSRAKTENGSTAMVQPASGSIPLPWRNNGLEPRLLGSTAIVNLLSQIKERPETQLHDRRFGQYRINDDFLYSANLGSDTQEVLNEEIITIELQRKLLDIFANVMSPLFPIVTKEDIANFSSTTSPALIYAVCGVASLSRGVPYTVYLSLRAKLKVFLMEEETLLVSAMVNIKTLLVCCMSGPWPSKSTVFAFANVRYYSAELFGDSEALESLKLARDCMGRWAFGYDGRTLHLRAKIADIVAVLYQAVHNEAMSRPINVSTGQSLVPEYELGPAPDSQPQIGSESAEDIFRTGSSELVNLDAWLDELLQSGNVDESLLNAT
ncbi:hypothetical protein P7C73_g1708, partial [Tremellales sp. Uapishka_1]